MTGPADLVAPLREAMLARGAGFAAAPMPARVLFGVDALSRLPELVDGLDARRVLVIASPGRGRFVQRVRALLGGRVVAEDTRVAMHVPEPVAQAVRADAARSGADLVLAIGGGSAIGMAKAVALAGGPPILALPTTYSGSEMTPIWGMTRGGAKETGRDERVRPRAVLYDPALTLPLAPRVSGPSALNAVAHCIEALYAPDASPLVALAAAEGLRALAASVPRVVREPADLPARIGALYGAWLGGLALGASTMGLHHKLCHVLGGSFGLPHAETHAILLPHSVAYNAAAAPEAMEVAGRALGAAAGDVPRALHALLADVADVAGAPRSLGEIGFRESDIDRAAEAAAAKPYPNPRPVRADALRELLGRALTGAVPESSAGTR
ncbi:MAG TPA: maleylacetate reductase [Gemmatimonadaceae bacterium]|nr:maleylacetate reductase [Gemmatimonadaceae bacterium]